MAKFQGQVITKQGSNLLARALAGEGKFIFTKAAFGNQKHTEHLEDITNLKSLKLNLNVVRIFNDDGDVVLILHITNEHLNEGFLTNEFGIFAKLEGDREEILYSYAVAEEPDSIPANTFGTTYETTTEIYMNFASNIETDIYVREGAAFLTEPRADEIYVKNEYPVHGNLKSKTQLKADHIYFDDSGNFYLNTGGDRIWNNSATPDIKLVKVTFKTIYTWITNIWADLKTKEPAITKKTGFNLDKTNLTENDSNKLFTAKGALDLFNTLTTNFTNAVNSAKEYFRTELVKKIDKTSKSDAVNSASSETIATSKAVKTAYDKAEAAIPIIDNTVVTNLNTVKGTKFFMVNGGDAIGMPTDSSFSSGDFNVAQFDSQEQRVQIIFNNYGVPFLRTNDVSRNQENYENAWGEWYRIWNERNFNPNTKLTRTINGDLEGLKRGTNGIFLSSGNTLNFGSNNNVYHFNYHTFPDSQQILEFYLNNGDSKGGMGDLYVKNLFTKGGYFEANSNSDAIWSQYRWRTKDGFWRFEAHPYSNGSGNKRMNLVYNDGSTDTFLAFPDIGSGQAVAYQSWVNAQRTWNNVSGKPSAFPPSTHSHTKAQITDFAHTHDDRYFTEAEVNTKFNSKHLEIVGKDYGGILNTAGAKTAGKTYFDNNTKKLFLCKNNNSDTSANVNNYIALDNNSLLDRLENLKSFVIESGTNSYGSYRKYNDGFIEQWGEDSFETNTFPVPFKRSCIVIVTDRTTIGDVESSKVESKTLTTFKYKYKSYGRLKSWYACGY
ncbi:phage tail protein [Fusobacterium gastrosuis]|uniref:phage tail protein n=1 Tax=Fusobacterium gastrosuis TaxID=1755100 RepID=UPI0029713928|nr:phage tail protein [Fusobacteriaceae bacterium]MDY5713627.1 phage tail protein [Fusobacterium gastrosuis]